MFVRPTDNVSNEVDSFYSSSSNFSIERCALECSEKNLDFSLSPSQSVILFGYNVQKILIPVFGVFLLKIIITRMVKYFQHLYFTIQIG